MAAPADRAITITEHDLDAIRKSEYHRGYVDGQRQRDADEWALDTDRRRAVQLLRNAQVEPYPNALGTMGNFMSAVTFPNPIGLHYTDDFELFRHELIRLLGGDVGKGGPSDG